MGQALLAKKMGKKRIIAETGAGQHGVASATAAAFFGMDCVVYMGQVDTERQALNVARMQLLGAEVIPVTSGSRTLKDAINEALRDWVANVDTTHYLLGTVAGPHPFPTMVRDFHSVIGYEAREQMLELTGKLPDAISAGLDYPGVGPEHSWLKDLGRANYHGVTDAEAMNAMRLLSQTEGIIPAIETAHGLAGIEHLAKILPAGAHILVNLSGRGDKDMETAAKYFGLMGDK